MIIRYLDSWGYMIEGFCFESLGTPAERTASERLSSTSTFSTSGRAGCFSRVFKPGFCGYRLRVAFHGLDDYL